MIIQEQHGVELLELSNVQVELKAISGDIVELYKLYRQVSAMSLMFDWVYLWFQSFIHILREKSNKIRSIFQRFDGD